MVVLDLGLDGRVLLFSIAAATLTGLLFGLAPAWRAARVDPQTAMKAQSRGVMQGGNRFTLGRALVVGQVALSLVLVVTAGLLMGSFQKLVTMDPGFRREGVLLVSMNLARTDWKDQERRAVHRQVLERLRDLAGVKTVAASYTTPTQRLVVERCHCGAGLRPGDRSRLGCDVQCGERGLVLHHGHGPRGGPRLQRHRWCGERAGGDGQRDPREEGLRRRLTARPDPPRDVGNGNWVRRSKSSAWCVTPSTRPFAKRASPRPTFRSRRANGGEPTSSTSSGLMDRPPRSFPG